MFGVQTKPTDFLGLACPPSLRTEPALAKPVLALSGQLGRLRLRLAVPTQGTWAMAMPAPAYYAIAQPEPPSHTLGDSVSFLRARVIMIPFVSEVKTISSPLSYCVQGGAGSGWEAFS